MNDLLICISNEGYAASLEPRKVYQRREDSAAPRRGLLRVVDESGEDYLYPAALFVALDLPQSARDALNLAAGVREP